MKKRNSARRIASFLLCLALFFGSFPADVHGAESEVSSPVPETILESVQEEISEITADETAEAGETGDVDSEDAVPEENPEISEGPEYLEEGTDAEEIHTEEMYHFSQEDPSTILIWKEHYIPNGFEDLLNYDESWWSSLYDYERELAEFLKTQIVILSEEVYDGQTLEECIAAIEQGTDAGSFFAGTVFRDMTLENLQRLRETGFQMEEVYDALMYLCREGNLEGWTRDGADEQQLQEFSDIVWDLAPASPLLRVSNGDLVADMAVSASGYKGTSHGTIWKLTVGGKPALCLSKGKSARNGFLYNAGAGTYEQKSSGLGFLISRAGLSGSYYACVQIAAWLYQQSGSYSKSDVETRAYGMLDESDDVIAPMIATIWNNYYAATQNSKSYYVFHSDNGNAQTAGLADLPSTHTYTGGGSEGGGDGGEEPGAYNTDSVSGSASGSIEAEAEVSIVKYDSITGETLPGARIEINGQEYVTDSSGKVKHKIKDSYEVSASGGTYTYVTDWDSLTAAQKADADSKGYYHSREEALAASEREAGAGLQGQLDAWAAKWSADVKARETAPPYGYNQTADIYSTTVQDGSVKSHSFYDKPWEAWVKLVKYDRITGQTDTSLSGAQFSVYEYDRQTGNYKPYRYSDRKIMKDHGDGTYSTGPLYYHPQNEGKFMILETRSPNGYTLDQKTNRFLFEITGENQIKLSGGNTWNTAGTYGAGQNAPFLLRAYNEPWKIRVDVLKTDEDTKEKLSGVQFDILRFNRDTGNYEVQTAYAPKRIEVAEQPDGTYLSGWIYWNVQNQGKLCLVESTARKGYFGDWKDRLTEWITGHPAGWQKDDADGKNACYFQITGSRTQEGIVDGYCSQRTLRASSGQEGTIQNERTKGRVRVVKYDAESESRVIQGDTTLEGAVYELCAAEDIVHADGHTGILYKKGDRVMTGTVGKSPAVDKYGYVLNTDGKRYASFGGEIQYRETPGEFSLCNIELGSYILREIQASEGYMLDETVYHLTFTYEDETQRVILRDETSAQDSNTLTADDSDPGHEYIYTGDYVQKQAFSIVKTSDNQFQTELEPVEGAGFTVYLISELKAVKAGKLTPADGECWSEADIRMFYDYDFSGEKPATVFKRRQESWTDGDSRWLIPLPDGGANEYLVTEMFTDSSGRLTSPELPYGSYVVVETTVPEKHAAARPFLVRITEDGGVVYTDVTKQTIQKSFCEEEDIRYGDHNKEQLYQGSPAYDPDASEGRAAQPVRYISDNRTAAYLRLIKADADFLPSEGTVLKPEELAAGTVLKEGAAYRIRTVNMTDRELETLIQAGWKQDPDGYLWYYELSARKTYGTEEEPFCPSVFRNRDGKITDCYLTLPAKLPTGSYELTELRAPSGYVRNGLEKCLTDTGSERIHSYRVTDDPKGAVRFVIDNQSVYPDGQLGENKYTLTDSYGNITCTVLQGNQEQKGVLELIKYGEKLYDFHSGPLGQIPDNNRKKGIFEYQNAPIEGAVFEICAAEDIYTQELDASMLSEYGVDISDYLVWSRDQKVAEICTDQSGYAYLSDLYIGKYYIREVFAGEGFVRNPEIQRFEITAQEDHVNFQWVSSIYENQRQKIDLKACKEDVESGEPLAGAVFGLYNRNDICTFITENPDRTVPEYRHILYVPDYVNMDEGKVLIPADTLLGTAVTDETGTAVFEEDLPMGEYYIRELESPPGYTSTDQEEEVTALWQGQETGTQEYTNCVFRNQRTKHVFRKVDMLSGIYIEGAHMEIWEAVTDEKGRIRRGADGRCEVKDAPVAVWSSQKAGKEENYFYEEGEFYLNLDTPANLPRNSDLICKEGHLVEKLTVGKYYILRETLAPENYVGYEASSQETKKANQDQNRITEEVMFFVEDDNMVFDHEMNNERTTGAFSVTKEGEFFAGTAEELKFTDRLKNLFVTIFQYVLGRVKNTSFEVYVRDDIYTPDQAGTYAEWTNSEGKTMLMKKDTHIETITTNQYGLATISGLPLGTYYLRESAVGNGTFLLNREEKEVVLSYVDQDTPVVFSDSASYVNQRQEISIELSKREAGTDAPVQGAVFGLYAGEDLNGYVIDRDRVISVYPKPMVEKDTLLETVESDEEGKAVFESDLPNGKYYVRELQAPEGYLISDDIWYIDASYRGADQNRELIFRRDVYNEISEAAVSKRDLTNGEEMEGASLEIIEEATGQVVDRWISETRAHRIGGIRLSEEFEQVYVLKEKLPAPGYVTAEEIRFVVREEEGLQEVWIWENQWKKLEDRCIVMLDNITRSEFCKTEEDGSSFLPGAQLELRDLQGTLLDQWTSGKEAHVLERIPIGTYVLREISAPQGYVTAEDLLVEVLDTAEVQKFTLKNHRIPERKNRTDALEAETLESVQPETVDAPLTGDSDSRAVWLTGVFLSLAGILWTVKKCRSGR